MKKKLFLFAAMVFAFCFMALTGANAATLYVDILQVCDGISPCYTHPQEAVNMATAGDTIVVYPGTYGTRYSKCPWDPTCGCGDTNAPALIVYKDND